MPWTATIKSVATDGGNVLATVEFTDGTETQNRVIRGDDLTEQRIAEFAHGVIASLEKRDAAKTALEMLVDQPLMPVAPLRPEYREVPSNELLSWAMATATLKKLKDANESLATDDSLKPIVHGALIMVERETTALNLNNTQHQQLLSALVAGGIFTQAESDSLYALAGWD